MKTKELIIKSLNIKEDSYYNMVFECGMYYLLTILNNEHLASEAGKIKEFWKWWQNQWEIRDMKYIRLSNIALIDEVLEGETRLVAINLYNDIHNPNFLKEQPNVWVRIEINKILISEIGKEESTIKQKVYASGR